jgi:hypothetical protein
MIRKIRNYLNLPYVFVTLTPFLLMAPLIFSRRAIFWGTPMLQFVPWWTQAWNLIKAGELPLWNTMVGMGAPLLANYQSALCYPPTWLYFLFASISGTSGIAWGQALLISAHLAWAGLGMAKLVRNIGWGKLAQTVSGLAFCLSGYLVSRSHFLSINATLSWLPWILTFAYDISKAKRIKSSFVLLIICIGMQLLAGHAQTSWYTFLLTLIWVGFWGWDENGLIGVGRGLKWLIAAVIFGAALASVQLFPTAEYLLNSFRVSKVEYQPAMTYSFWPWSIVTLFAPKIFGSPMHGNYWGYANYWEGVIYIGLLPVLMAFKAIFRPQKSSNEKRLVLFLVGVTFVSILLALGKNTPIYPWLYQNVPTFDMFNSPGRFTIWLVFAFSLLAGLGVENWFRPIGKGLYWSRLAIAAAFAFTIGAGLGWYLLSKDIPSFQTINSTFIPAIAMLGIWGIGTGVLNLLAPIKHENQKRDLWKWMVCFVLSLDLIVANSGVNPGIELENYSDPSPSAEQIHTLRDGHRVYLPSDVEQRLKFDRFLSFESFELDEPWINLRAVMLPNVNILDGIELANNFDPIIPARYAQWMEAVEDAPWEVQKKMLVLMDVGLLERIDPEAPLGVRFDILDSYNEIKNTYVEDNKRILWMPCARFVPDGNTSLQLIQGGLQEKYLDEVILEGVPTTTNSNCDVGEVKFIHISGDSTRLNVTVETTSRGWLVMPDVWYPGWKARIDDDSTELMHANFLFRAVEVPEGIHEVEVIYQPLSFYLGILISLVVLLGIIMVSRNRRILHGEER